jgi:MFS family permease
VLAGIAASALTSILDLSFVVAIVGWSVAGAGMGTMAPRQSARVLRLSPPEQQGFNSSALLIADSIGAALTIAATGVVFTLFTSVGPAGGAATYTASFALSALVAVMALVLVSRVRDGVKISPSDAAG